MVVVVIHQLDHRVDLVQVQVVLETLLLLKHLVVVLLQKHH